MNEFDKQLLEKILDTMDDCLDSTESVAKLIGDDERLIEDIITTA